MLGGFYLFSVAEGFYKYALLSLPVIIFSLSFFKIPKISQFKKLIRLASVLFLLSCVLSHAYFNMWFRAYDRYENEEVEIDGVIRNVYTSGYSTYITVNSNCINNDAFTNYKILIVINSGDDVLIESNTRVKIKATLSDFENTKSDFDENSYYESQGYSAKIDKLYEIKNLGRVDEDFSTKIYKSRTKLSMLLVERTNEETGGLLAALLLGEKTMLSPQTSLDFKRIGISHMLALSGLHLSILTLGLSKVLSLFRIGKKPRYLLSILFTFLYMTITCFPVSVVRAGLMLIIAYSLFLFAKAQDSMTALVISVAAICSITPFAIYDISLWLSALATLGIVSLMEFPKKNEKQRSKVQKALDYIKNSLIVSFFAISATFALSVFSFEEISLISAISTLAFSFLLEIFLFAGTLLLFFGAIIPFSAPVISIARMITWLAELFAKPNFISVSTDFAFIKALVILFSIFFFAFLILNIKNKKRAVILLTSFMFLINVTAFFAGFIVKQNDSFYYCNDKSNENFIVIGNGESVVINEATYSDFSAYNVADIIKSERLTTLDKYVITNYSSNIPASLYSLLSEIPIEEIYIPEPKNKAEREIFNEANSLLSIFHTRICTYTENETLSFKKLSYTELYREEYLKKTVRSIFEISYGSTKYTYFSSGTLKDEMKNTALPIMTESDVLIFGKHGVDYYNYSFVYELENAEAIIISSENMYMPEQMKSFYKKSGTEIYSAPEKVDFIR
jgi:competence protein ComEC